MIHKNQYRTHSCGELTAKNVGETVRVAGWVTTVRDHGGITFIDLRDHYGTTQILLKEDKTELAAKLTRETVVSVSGKVVMRGQEAINSKLPTGEIEVEAATLTVLGECLEIPPFDILDSRSVNEEVRLKYRYLDLRNPEMQKNVVFRSRVVSAIRRHMTDLGFNEITTPILTVSSPEGARDYIVPSRLHHGKFYALPQAPQQFKQLLMVAGMEKYFQIAPCFRDEDARADRCPGEFYQLDMEMSFATQEDVFSVIETIMPKIFNEFGAFGSNNVKAPFLRLPYKESMEKYGSDKPDLRNPLLIRNFTEILKNTTFAPFQKATVKAISVNVGEKGRRWFDKISDFTKELGAKSLGWLSVTDTISLDGPLVKYLTEAEQKAMVQTAECKKGDTLFIIAMPTYRECTKIMGYLRTELANQLDLIDRLAGYKFCWIIDYPMFEENEETGGIDFSHNPFSMPQGGLKTLEEQDPFEVLAYQYDLVVNGVELSSGAVRNHDVNIMKKAFAMAGYDEETLKTKFAALYNAFHYGAPPHAGIAPGIDRMVMLLLGEQSIREVVTFPMNKRAQDVMMGAPGDVTEKQLREVHIKIRQQN